MNNETISEEIKKEDALNSSFEMQKPKKKISIFLLIVGLLLCISIVISTYELISG